MSRFQIVQRVLNSLFILLLLVVSPGLSGQARAKPSVYSYANGLQLAAGVPLPVFQVTTPVVSPDTTQHLAGLFEGILIGEQGSDDYLKHARFTI